MPPSVVLGLNCSHDAAAALAVDGVLVAAMSEERLTKRKHCDGLPVHAIEYCLQEAGLDPRRVTISRLVINQLPATNFDLQAVKFFGLPRVSSISINPSHHYLHACYAELLTDERPLIVLVVDGSGYTYAEHKRHGSPLLGDEPEHVDLSESLTAYLLSENGETSLLMKDWGCWRDMRTNRFPSLGHMYGCAAQHVFGSWVHAGKLMGLAPLGDPAGLGGTPIVRLTPDGVEVDTDWLVGAPRIQELHHPEAVPLARDIAAKAQAELEKGMMHICSLLAKQTGCRTICLTGGVALNSVFNGRLSREGLFDRVVVSPASSDAGTAIGATAYGKALTGKRLHLSRDIEFLGREYDDQAIAEALHAAGSSVRFARCEQPHRQAVDDLAQGLIVGWFEGASEFGPRALGHRSILADPRRGDIKDHLNHRVKFREPFRPYGAAILEEHCAEWFEQRVDSPHMLMVATVKPTKKAAIPAVVHVDDTCRLQTVAPTYPGALRRLIEAFFEKTGVPLVLNTSLNSHGLPMAETPADAVECLVGSGMDVLYCGHYRIEKVRVQRTLHDVLQGRLVVGRVYELIGRYDADAGSDVGDWSLRQGARLTRITTGERDLLMNLRGHKTIADVARSIPATTVEQVLASVRSLCDRGVLRIEPSTDTPAQRAVGDAVLVGQGSSTE